MTTVRKHARNSLPLNTILKRRLLFRERNIDTRHCVTIELLRSQRNHDSAALPLLFLTNLSAAHITKSRRTPIQCTCSSLNKVKVQLVDAHESFTCGERSLIFDTDNHFWTYLRNPGCSGSITMILLRKSRHPNSRQHHMKDPEFCHSRL